MGKPIAADVPTALRTRTLHQIMKGTERNAPPAPTMLDTTPIVAPTPKSPGLPGSVRLAFGSRFWSIWTPAKPVNAAKSAATSADDMTATICGPTNEPATMPGARPHITCQSTAPRRACARMLDNDVNMMVASDVATAM